MSIEVALRAAEEIAPLREAHCRALNCQIVRYAWCDRGWTDAYTLRLDGSVVGYALVGGVGGDPKDEIVEFHVVPTSRAAALPLFRELAAVSRARTVVAQTNDPLLTLMVYDCARAIESDTILFHDAFTTQLAAPGATFRRAAASDADRVFAHTLEPVGDWLIESGGAIVATGGLLFHYNPPYGDIHMEVAEPLRRRGFGSFLVQELKRTCYESGRVPAARCRNTNAASRATLQKAGMLPCARVLVGRLGD